MSPFTEATLGQLQRILNILDYCESHLDSVFDYGYFLRWTEGRVAIIGSSKTTEETIQGWEAWIINRETK
jgi:hypothetical protein